MQKVRVQVGVLGLRSGVIDTQACCFSLVAVELSKLFHIIEVKRLVAMSRLGH